MGLLEKVKNMFTEEIEEDEPIKKPVKPVKKEVMQVEIESPRASKLTNDFDFPKDEYNNDNIIGATDFGLDDEVKPISKEKELNSEITKPTRREKPAPIYFDDNDFKELEKPRFRPKKVKKEVYRPIPEKKAFKPSLNISPVYGVLDKNYKKEDLTSKTEYHKSSYGRTMSIDEVREKAYGSDLDPLKSNNYEETGNTEILEELVVSVREKLQEDPIKNDINSNLDNIENQLNSLEENLVDANKHSKSDELNIGDNIEDNDIPVNEDDLFDLIDSMYEKRDELE